MNCCTLSVFFEDPFWVGLCQLQEGKEYRVCRIVFGAEPKDAEVHQYLLRHWNDLRFSPAIAGGPQERTIKNPKRRQREIRRELERASSGAGTKAQQALQLQREAGREQARQARKERRETREEEQFLLRQQKRREKHRGH